MNVARRFEPLLSAKMTLCLLEFVGKGRLGQGAASVAHDFVALHPTTGRGIHSTIALLDELKVLSIDDQGVRTVADCPADNAHQHLANIVAERVAAALNGSSIACLRATGVNDCVGLDSMLLPREIDWISPWMIDFGVAERQFVSDRLWFVRGSYAILFIDAARAANSAHVHGRRKLTDLKDKINRDEENGKAAEEWVLRFERNRLHDHALCDQVKRISEENVDAGYDIASFSSASSLQYDWFIEVKSYAGHKRFYWTRNEIETARKLGEKYSIYLVDRALMNSASYTPQVIRGPYSALFESKATGWDVSPSVYECEVSVPEGPVEPK